MEEKKIGIKEFNEEGIYYLNWFCRIYENLDDDNDEKTVAQWIANFYAAFGKLGKIVEKNK